MEIFGSLFLRYKIHEFRKDMDIIKIYYFDKFKLLKFVSVKRSMRFYSDKYPSIGDFVVVKHIKDDNCHLLEYNNKEGLIMNTNSTSYPKCLFVCKILNIDVNDSDDISYKIDLIRPKIKNEKMILERYYKIKHIHDKIINYSNMNKLNSKALIKENLHGLHFGMGLGNEIYESICNICDNGLRTYLSNELCDLETNISYTIDVRYYGYEGIDAIKDIFRKVQNSHPGVKIFYNSSPYYDVVDSNRNVNNIKSAIIEIRDKMKEIDGIFELKKCPNNPKYKLEL